MRTKKIFGRYPALGQPPSILCGRRKALKSRKSPGTTAAADKKKEQMRPAGFRRRRIPVTLIAFLRMPHCTEILTIRLTERLVKSIKLVTGNAFNCIKSTSHRLGRRYETLTHRWQSERKALRFTGEKVAPERPIERTPPHRIRENGRSGDVERDLAIAADSSLPSSLDLMRSS